MAEAVLSRVFPCKTAPFTES